MTFELYFGSLLKGFEFPDSTPFSILQHLKSEVLEVEEELLLEQATTDDRSEQIEDEIGDALSCLCFLMLNLEIDPREVMMRNWMKLEDRAVNGKRK